jgi:regulator of CtrA degradation
VSEPDVIKLGTGTVPFGHSFVHSDAFKALFQEGMELVEDTASYLDGQGRIDSKLLPREGVIAYAAESMRLTTRLMQIASWLLLQRAVAEGEMSLDQAQLEKNRVHLTQQDTITTIEDYEALPARLKELIGLATRVHARILHLERLMSEPEAEPIAPRPNPVAAQQRLLEQVFGAR